MATEYIHNVEIFYTKTDTTIQRINNTIGYYADSKYYHYIKDHLGNICAVVDSENDSLVQSTLYYASGVPMSQSSGRDKQSYLYNSKEFVEAHGYNTYDYGFRGYYAPIGRFTSIDPLAEQTPWLSPYAYAGNNFSNCIDWMGLSGIMSGLHYTELDNDGVVTVHIDNGDNSVYINGKKIGTELDDEEYIVGWRAFFKHDGLGVIMIYHYSTGHYIRPSTPWEKRVEIWLRAKNVDKLEKNLLKYEQGILQEIVLMIPILSQYNDMSVLIYGKDVYGRKKDSKDKENALISLIIGGIARYIPIKQVADDMDDLISILSIGNTIGSIQGNYETNSQSNH